MPLFFKPTHTTQARQLREEVLMALDDPAKIAFLAKVLNCKHHEVRTHPRLMEILDKIENLFLSWINPEAGRTNMDIHYIADLHDRAKVPLSWVFEVMRKIHAKARVLKLPDCFFERSDDFLQRLIQAQEKLLLLHQEKFQEERAYWHTIFNLSASPMIVMDEKGQVIEVNNTYAKIHGYTLEAFKEELRRGASLIEMTVPSERQAEAASSIQAALSSQDGVIFEFVNKTRDGRLFPTLDMLKKVKTSNRQLLLLTQIDLTEVKAKERAIEEERAYWKTIFNLSPSPMIVMDGERHVIDVNDAYAKIHGYTLEAFLTDVQRGMNPMERFVPPEWNAVATQALQKASSSDEPILFEMENIDRQGNRKPTLDMIQRIERQGKPLYLLAQVDLTEFKAKKQALEAEKNKSEVLQAYWKTLFTEAPVGMVIYDVDGHYHQVNPKFCAMTGCSEAELLDPRFDYKTILAEKLDDTLAQVRNAIETGRPQAGELVINSKSKRVEVLCTTVRLPMQDTKGRPLLAAWHQDITELKEREHEIRQLLDDAQTYLQRLAAAMLVHDERDTTGAARLLQKTYNQCVDHLQALMGTVSRAAQTLMASSKELTQGQMVLSERASKEAASLEEISANVEEISSAVSESAKNAQETQAITEEILKLLNTSTNAINDVVEVIFGAAKAARETTQIAKLIEEIAFTTNLLSLNASVEAARAGQHGRGFAVIAEEVRRLALKVSEESQRAQAIIQTLLDAIGKGESGVQQVATVMDQIDGKSHTIAEHIQAIARATQEQDEGLKQIAQGINILDEGLAQNAAMAEEIHGTTIGLQEQAERLVHTTQQFESDRDFTVLANGEDSFSKKQQNLDQYSGAPLGGRLKPSFKYSDGRRDETWEAF
jgi:PAS domain S-box-containing protein